MKISEKEAIYMKVFLYCKTAESGVHLFLSGKKLF